MIVGVMAAGVIAAISFSPGNSAFAGANDTMTVDLDTGTAGIQSTRTVGSGATIDIAIVSSSITTDYNGYQWELEWDDARLNFSSASENTAGHGGSLCAPATTTTDSGAGVPSGKEWAGQGAGCLRPSGTTNFAGDLVTITVQCQADGTTPVHLVGPNEDTGGFHASFIGNGGTLITTAYVDALLSCGSASSTDTPTATNTVPPTGTPIPNATNTPCVSSICTNPPFTRTNTPTSTITPGGPTLTPSTGTTPPPGGGSPAATATRRPGGGAGGSIGGPDTGQGPGSGGGDSGLMVALLVSGAGLALAGAGGWKLRRRSARSRA
jgi:hypothetical protein